MNHKRHQSTPVITNRFQPVLVGISIHYMTLCTKLPLASQLVPSREYFGSTGGGYHQCIATMMSIISECLASFFNKAGPGTHCLRMRRIRCHSIALSATLRECQQKIWRSHHIRHITSPCMGWWKSQAPQPSCVWCSIYRWSCQHHGPETLESSAGTQHTILETLACRLLTQDAKTH